MLAAVPRQVSGETFHSRRLQGRHTGDQDHMSSPDRNHAGRLLRRAGVLIPAVPLLAAVVLLIAAAGCSPTEIEPGENPEPGVEQESRNTEGEPADDEAPARTEKEIRVDAGEVRRGDLVIPVFADGVLRTTRSLEVRTKIGGELVEVAVREGDRVRKGQLLARVDPREHALALQDSRSRYIQALSQLKAEIGTIETDGAALEEFSRQKDDLERQHRSGTISQDDYQARLLELELHNLSAGTFRQQVLEQRTGLADARSARERARLNLEYTEIRAPFGGVVERVQVVPGELVGVNSPICALYNNDHMEAVVHVLEGDLGNLAERRPALLSVPAVGDTIRARVDVISPRIDQASRTCEILLRFGNPDGRYRPGMFVRAEIAGWIHRDRLMVPKAAVLTRDDRPLVFKVNGNRAEWLYITKGLENDAWTEVVSVHSGGSLTAGDQVVVANHLTLAHEARISIGRINPPGDRWDAAGEWSGTGR